MTSPKKPEYLRTHKNHREVADIEKTEEYVQGYNQACDDWQAYYDHIMRQLPDVEELKKIVRKILKLNEITPSMQVKSSFLSILKESLEDDTINIANAIYNRQREIHKGGKE